MKRFFCLILCLLCCCFPTACKKDCEHQYAVRKTVSATCTKDGYTVYKCTECGDRYKETIEANGHTKGAEPTLDASQVCTVCGLVLATSVDYMAYRGSDLVINQHLGYGDGYTKTPIVSQNLDRYTLNTIPYFDQNGEARNLNLNIPIQDFFKHSVSSVAPLTTADGKTYSTDSGFMLSFDFTSTAKDVTTLHAWNYGLSTEFRHSNPALLKVVGSYQAQPSYYNKVYELVDFSDSYIEIAQQTENGYKAIKKIQTEDEWTAILQNGNAEIYNKDGALFYEPGTYRVLFKYDMTWIADSDSPVYTAEDAEKTNPIYPFDKVNDQYDSFYITITEERNNVLIPNDIETSDSGFFCQLRALTTQKKLPFITSGSNLNFENGVVFKVGAKVDMTKTGYYYNHYKIKDFVMTLSYADDVLEKYHVYQIYDLVSK